MAQRKQKQLTGPSARSIAQLARQDRDLAKVAEIADANLNPTDEWRTVLPEHIEAIKTRLLAGDTLGRVCRRLGINRASVVRHIHEHPDLLEQYLAWKAFGTHQLYENLLELPFDDSMSDADKMLYYKVVSNYAPKMNRRDYGDKVQVEHSVVEPFIIEGSLLPNSDDDGV